ncbi:MAG: hypothetical protein ACYDC2_04530 [Solirubrobacteraceae bacterium]
MTLTTAILLIAIADLALIAGLAWTMSRPAKLAPHVPVAPAQQPSAMRRRSWRPVSPQAGGWRSAAGRREMSPTAS